MFGLKKKKKQEPTLKELCDAVAEHPDSVIVAVFERSDFAPGVAERIDHDEMSDRIYDSVMSYILPDSVTIL
jgi:hypothetical protein